jgi:glycosyltransferase involved in cell wall biosynthesis
MLSGPVLVIPDLSRDSTALSDLLGRFNSYGQKLAETTQGERISLNLFTGTLSENTDSMIRTEFPFLNVVSATGNRVKFAWHLYSEIRENKKFLDVLIAGDPWITFLICLLARIFFGIPIQVSIHGEPYLRVNAFGSFRGLIKHFWLKLFLNRAQSVRLVSIHQIEPVINFYRVKRYKISVSPIPIRVPMSAPSLNKNLKVIGIVGRLHPERGLDSALQIISKLFESRQDFSLWVVGDGSERFNFERKLSNQCPGLSVTFTGSLRERDLEKIWNRISILLSTAESESFGRSLRESVLHGIPVVAKSNGGTEIFKSSFGKGIFVFEDTEQAVRSLSLLLDSPSSVVNVEEVREIQALINQQSLNTLIGSWIQIKQ